MKNATKKAPLEKDIQSAILDYLALRGYFFWRNNSVGVYDPRTKGFRNLPKYSMKGVADILMIRNGTFWAIECKRPGTYQTAEQKEFQRLCEENGGKYMVARDLTDILKAGL